MKKFKKIVEPPQKCGKNPLLSVERKTVLPNRRCVGWWDTNVEASSHQMGFNIVRFHFWGYDYALSRPHFLHPIKDFLQSLLDNLMFYPFPTLLIIFHQLGNLKEMYNKFFVCVKHPSLVPLFQSNFFAYCICKFFFYFLIFKNLKFTKPYWDK